MGDPTVISVDLNWMHEGLLWAFVEDASRPVKVGEIVCAVDEDETVVTCRVLSVDDVIIQMQILSEAGI